MLISQNIDPSTTFTLSTDDARLNTGICSRKFWQGLFSSLSRPIKHHHPSGADCKAQPEVVEAPIRQSGNDNPCGFGELRHAGQHKALSQSFPGKTYEREQETGESGCGGCKKVNLSNFFQGSSWYI